MDEVLISEHESSRSYIFNKDYYFMKPEIKINRDFSYIKNKVSFEKFSSADNIKDKVFLHDLLDRGGFLE